MNHTELDHWRKGDKKADTYSGVLIDDAFWAASEFVKKLPDGMSNEDIAWALRMRGSHYSKRFCEKGLES